MNLDDEIAKVAYEIYERSGYIKGRDFVNWLEAERIVLARHKGPKAEGRKETAMSDERFAEKSERTKPARKATTAKKVTAKAKKKSPSKEPGKAVKKGARKNEE